MVSITNGIKTFKVTAGAVEPYLNMGFRVISDSELQAMQNKDFEEQMEEIADVVDDTVESSGEEEADEMAADEAFVTELLEKPLSQWSGEETKEFVRIRDIDTSGVKKLSQVKEIVKAYLDEQAKNA